MTTDRRSRLAPVLWIGVVAAYLAAAFWPFDFDLPRYHENRIVRSDDGSLRFVPPSTARSPRPPDWLAAAIAAGDLEVDLEVRALEGRQSGPARIFTVSKDPYRTDLTVAQQGSHLVVRLRRPGTGPLGTPPLRVLHVLGDRRWHRVGLVLRDGTLVAVVDGRAAARWSLGPAALRSWDPSYRLALGDELTGGRSWHGVIRRARVTVGGRTYDHLAPGALEAPRSWWYVPRKPPGKGSASPADVVLNVAGFVPFGAFVAWRRGRGGRVPVATAGSAALAGGLASLALSAAMELGQLAASGRAPTVRDLVLNVTGGVLGAAGGARFASGAPARQGGSEGTTAPG